jgi:single-strand DNA-binding protein
VANFTVAVSRNARSATTGSGRTSASSTAWRHVADNTAQSFRKGSRVLVAGRLVQRTFETEGQRRTTTEIQVQHLAADIQYAVVEIKKVEASDSEAPAEEAG